MFHLKIILATIAILIIAVSTSLVVAGDGVRLRGSNFQVDTIRLYPDSAAGLIGKTHYRVRVDQSAVMLHWSASPFRHTAQPEILADASVAATVVHRLGNVQTSTNHAAAKTSVRDGRHAAEIALGVAGRGQVRCDLFVELNPNTFPGQFTAAGTYQSTVTLTVASN
jgi:hypothetical protein